MSKLNETDESMNSQKGSKSEEDFLKEFEAELAGEDLDDFWNNFGNAMMESEDTLDLDEVEESEGNPLDVFTMDMSASDSFSLGGVDLGTLLDEASDGASPFDESASPLNGDASPFDEVVSPFDGSASPFDEPTSPLDSAVSPFDELSVKDDASDDDMGDVFASLFGDSAASTDGMNFDDSFGVEIPQADSSEGMDLSNMGEADLMSLLSGDDELSDIGNMLSSDGSADFGGEDAFAAFAEGEMAVQEAEEEDGSKKKKKKKKKDKKKKPEKKKARPTGFMGKLYDFFDFLMKEQDGKEEIDLDEFNAITPDMLADENAEILAAFANLEDKTANAKPEKKKKEKKKKEKKEKKEKPKKEKKPKKTKEPKPKKEKKPKPVDNTPPLPRGPVIIIWLMVISMFALVMLSVNLFSYSSAVSQAKTYHDEGEYAAAYGELVGVTLKEKDMMLYNQVATLAAVDSELNAFDAFLVIEKHQEALDSLICAAGRCEVNADNAEVYECQGQMQILKAEVSNKLHQNYGMTYEEAIEIYESRSRDDYSVALIEKLRSLGLVE